jgi:RHS repeat-associated protein
MTESLARPQPQDGQPSPFPAITVPKGGGAIRGIGEKFAANPVSGTGSMTVPIATSPGREGFGPQLSLSYDSGSGNGPFGFGWGLGLPAITRNTDKGLPQYHDGVESDVFLLSGAEDLVPVYRQDADGAWVAGHSGYERDPSEFWVRDTSGRLLIHEDELDGYRVRRYRPRIEGLFARIERWTSTTRPEDVHWRSWSRDNLLTLYGKDASARIYDPADPSRIFSWLICETRDTKGNAVIYCHKAEDGAQADLTSPPERNRGGPKDPRRAVNRYPKRIRYANRVPLLDTDGQRPRFLTKDQLDHADWCFEVVFDYGEHDLKAPMPDETKGPAWLRRPDPFSTYRPGFEVRTYRLCRRILMFHHFPREPGVGCDCLVRSTDFGYTTSPIASFLVSATQRGYRRDGTGYICRSMPAVEFGYSQAIIDDTIHDVDGGTLENLPMGIDGAAYRLVDLDSEGLEGVLADTEGGWRYKPNLGGGRFGRMRLTGSRPSTAALSSGSQKLLDLAGDGSLGLVSFSGPTPGFFERTDGTWEVFRPFRSLPQIAWDDPGVRMVDLTGDGVADVLLTEDDVFTWYPSLGEDGFAEARRAHQPRDEEQGPRLVDADGIQQIYLADMSGDGLNDLVRVRNGEVCYWPSLGYGRFGAKITMATPPVFDQPDQFSQQRLRLADIDGSGTTDLIYLGREGARLYFNQSGNGWSGARRLSQFPSVDDLATVTTADLLGNGTACLVWSSPLPQHQGRQLRYIDLMSGRKPHLLIKTSNNLGAETRVHYAPSTTFYLHDRAAGRPWVTRLPFPVQVVEQVETCDWIGRNRFVTRYAYHHGFFDGVEREFRGFAMVEQWDSETMAVLTESTDSPVCENVDGASHVPPVHTKTWFHTGVYLGRGQLSRYFAGLLDAQDIGEYYREPLWRDDDEARKRLLDDTVLPDDLSPDEQREACRALKGSMLRQEIYAQDGSAKADTPYTVTEQNFTVRMLQARGRNRQAVFLTHAREAINYHYERNPDDPRISHTLTLEVDPFGNVLKEAAVAYGRRKPDATLTQEADCSKQTRPLITYTERRVSDPVADDGNHHTPLPAETRTYELTGYMQSGTRSKKEDFSRFQAKDFVRPKPDDPERFIHVFDRELQSEAQATSGRQRRLVEHIRTLYRRNDLTALLDVTQLQSLALPGESYKLAFTPGLIKEVFQRPHHEPPHDGPSPEDLIPDPATLLGKEGGYVDLDGDGHWWVPTGRTFYSPGSTDTPGQELAYARRHFFLTHRYRDAFSQTSTISFDNHKLLLLETCDPVSNRVTVGERKPSGDIDEAQAGNDYRVLQPWRVMDANRNRTQAAFDALGLTVGTAIMGKPEENLGDTLTGFEPDLTETVIRDHLATPLNEPHAVLQSASTRLVYDLFAYQRTKNQPDPQPAVAYTLARETHHADPGGPQSRVQHAMAYSDGFGREVQRKIQAEPGPAPRRDPNGKVNGADGQPEMTASDVRPRWVGSGWTIYSNKGKPVRQYEPFFSNTHRFEFSVRVGVSPVLFYDPLGRVVATLHPNHTYEKVVLDAWRQTSYDVNDTIARRDPQTGDPRIDPDITDYLKGYFATEPADWQTWYAQRSGGPPGTAEVDAATKAAAHADTPAVAHLDTLGRPFMTVTHNRYERNSAVVEERSATRIELDVEGNQRAVRDERTNAVDALKQRVVMHYDYDLLRNRIHQSSMEAGERWTLNDAAGKQLHAWDSQRFLRRTTYDELRRPTGLYVTDGAGPERLAVRTVYGESQGDASNLRGRVYQVFDDAGIVTSVSYDFKGNLLESRRDLVPISAQPTDWLHNPQPANDGTFTSRTTYDAVNRVLTSTTPDGSVYLPTFNEANLLDKVDVRLRGAAAATSFVTDIDYNAKGQRTLVSYASGTETAYEYDPLTFRLTNLKTTRPGPNVTAARLFRLPIVVQDLHYTYDPVGNITRIEDAALKTVFHANQQVDPVSRFTYDALYRLTEARGREHIGQMAFASAPADANFRDYPFAGQRDPSDLQALRNYIERYEYDAAGNFQTVRHIADGGNWTRSYEYNADSPLELGRKSNRLTGTTIGNGVNRVGTYAYDEHGNMTAMPHLTSLSWDFADRLEGVSLVGGTASYVYDAAGERVRKVIASANGTRRSERIYLGGFEIYREFAANGTGVTLKRESLHVMDNKNRLALVETETVSGGNAVNAPVPLKRHQLGNHLGSASVELAADGTLISYEEYHPYGTTALQAGRSAAEPSLKRYRYIGKERDEESGLYYHSARYYAPWLSRWTACDPLGVRDGPNLYMYVNGNPIRRSDPGGTAGLGWTDRAASQFHLIQQSELRQPITATAKGRGISQSLRNAYQELANQWRFGAVDVGHVKPFWSLRAGEESPTYIQSRVENQLNGATIDKAAKAEAAAKGQYTRVGDTDPTAVPGTKHGQAERIPKLEGLGKSKPGVIGPSAAVALEAPSELPKAMGALPEQRSFDFESSLPASKAAEAPVASAETHIAASAETHIAASAETHIAASAETHIAASAGARIASSELSAAQAGERLAAERFGAKGAFAHIPVLGFYIALDFVERDLNRHDYINAVLDLVGPIPYVGEAALAIQLAPVWAQSVYDDVIMPVFAEGTRELDPLQLASGWRW